MVFEKILLDIDGSIAKITLNNPKTRNALNIDMRTELIYALRDVGENDAVKAVILTGAGDSFCSGGDLKTLEDVTAIEARMRLRKSQEVIKSLFEMEKPIIAAINGVTAGAGVSIAVACDILIASEKAKFCVAFTKVGAVPDLGEYYFLTLRVGIPKTKELMITGDMIGSREAERIGLVNRVVSHEKLEEECFVIAKRVAKGPSQAYAMIKMALNRWPAHLEYFLEMERSMQAVAFTSEDFREGRKAFLEKREPVFKGR